MGKRGRPKGDKPAKVKMHPGRVDGRGGKREGAGRKKGSTVAKLDAQHLKERHKIMPLDHMLAVLNGLHPQTGQPLPKKGLAARQDEMAKIAAPYIHPRLSSVDVNSITGSKRHSIDVTKLTDEELVVFERILSKALVTKSPEEVATVIEHVKEGSAVH